eukprot:28884_1
MNYAHLEEELNIFKDDQINNTSSNIYIHYPCPKKFDNTYQEQLSKTAAMLTINNIPYSFSGRYKEDIHNFQHDIMRYTRINGISSDILTKLLLNGHILKGEAFTFILRQEDNLKVMKTNDEKLHAIWTALKNEYKRMNKIHLYRQQLNRIEQGKLTLKEYMRKFNTLVEKLNLEIKIQKEIQTDLIRPYLVDTNYDSYYLIFLFLQGANMKVIDDIMRDSKYDDFMPMNEFEKILNRIIRRELRVKSISNNFNNQTAMNQNQHKSVSITNEINRYKHKLDMEISKYIHMENKYNALMSKYTHMEISLNDKHKRNIHLHQEIRKLNMLQQQMNLSPANSTVHNGINRSSSSDIIIDHMDNEYENSKKINKNINIIHNDVKNNQKHLG